MIDVSIIYVNWNCSEEIVESVASIKEMCTGCSYEIIVLDNKSSEDLHLLRRDDIRLIENPVNGGFGAGCNAGAKHAHGKYFLFLNPDTILYNDVPGILCEFMEKTPECGACGSKMLHEDGSVYFGAGRRYLTPFYDLLEHSSLCFRYPKHPILGRPYYGSWDHLSTREVECLIGACMMFRREVFEALSGFDEDFFLYCEEVDLCRRTIEAGYKIFYVHTAELLHKCRKSTMKYYKEYSKIYVQYLNSSEFYYQKHYGKICAALWRLAIGAVYFAKFLGKKRQEDLLYAKWGFYLV